MQAVIAGLGIVCAGLLLLGPCTSIGPPDVRGMERQIQLINMSLDAIHEQVAAVARPPVFELVVFVVSLVFPIFGQIQQARGFRQFLLRGMGNMRGEWRLVCLTHRPTYPVESPTLSRIRDALAAWCPAWRLGRVGRGRLLQHAAWQISYTRNRNAAGTAGHRKTTLEKLRKQGLDMARIRTCAGSDLAL